MAKPGRPENALKTVPLRLSITKPILDNLEALVPSGLYGNSVPEVAVHLVRKGINDLQQAGHLPRWYERTTNEQPKPEQPKTST